MVVITRESHRKGKSQGRVISEKINLIIELRSLLEKCKK